MINSVNSTGTIMPMNVQMKKTVQQENKTETIVEQEAYSVDIGNVAEKKATYGNPGVVKPDSEKIEQLKKKADEAMAPLRQMVEELLKKQGLSFKGKNLKADEGKSVEIDEGTREEAQKLISDGGEYSIENTSDRLFEFAKAISGGDKTKFDELKSAISNGYTEAEKAFGGKLPDICQKTIDSTMEKLDNWSKSEE